MPVFLFAGLSFCRSFFLPVFLPPICFFTGQGLPAVCFRRQDPPVFIQAGLPSCGSGQA